MTNKCKTNITSIQRNLYNLITWKIAMKDLLYLCTEKMHFSFDDNIYWQIDGVSLRMPLTQILEGNLWLI